MGTIVVLVIIILGVVLIGIVTYVRRNPNFIISGDPSLTEKQLAENRRKDALRRWKALRGEDDDE